MRVNWIVKEGHEKLVVIALGWGASPEVINNQIYDDNYDVVAFYDYNALDVNVLEIVEGYKEVSLLAWSFGVWASDNLFRDFKFTRAVAVGGTPKPIDRKYGIHPRIFDVTLKAVLTEGVVKFIVRMCGKYLKEYLKHFSLRDLEDCRRELEVLNKMGRETYTPKIEWDEMVGFGKDLIFPHKSIQNYCADFGFKYSCVESSPHYPFYDKEFIRCKIKS